MIDPNQDRTKFNDRRHTFIGGSDIAAILGLSNWNTPLSVWAKKTGQITDDLSGVEVVQMGVKLEPMVCQLFEERSGKKVRVETREFTHPEFPYMMAHVDRWLVGGDGAIFEAKTASAYKLQAWQDDEVPEDYQLQCNWYSGLVGLHRGKAPKDSYIGVLIGGQRFIWTKLKFDQELFDLQVERAKEFWEVYVLPKVPPMAVAGDQDTLVELFPESRPETLKTIVGGDDELAFNELAVSQIEGKSQIKEIDKEVDDAENKLRQLIGEDEGLETGLYKASWKSQQSSSVDTQKMKDTGIYEDYVVRKQIRVLRVTQKKLKAK